ncbi:MAG TPA: SMC-Scp complex subunit ScpB [Candidatus Acidoferrales bacterium]|nr:SMC-Scp complex subunit ScpB [Candidatus Acidoferrales bacterium]
MNPAEIKGALEAIIYAADEPATVDQMAAAIGIEKAELRPVLDELVASYGSDERGVEIREVAGGFKFYTKPQHHEAVRRFIKSLRPPLRLTMSALETLAVIAYKQPVTQPEIQEIRGVNSSGVLQTLLEKRLITTAGRKAVIGRPILYRSSKEFLMRFGLSDVGELPSLKEFELLARQALGTDEGIAAAEPEDLEPVEPSLEVDQGLDHAAQVAAAAADAGSVANADGADGAPCETIADVDRAEEADEAADAVRAKAAEGNH